MKRILISLLSLTLLAAADAGEKLPSFTLSDQHAKVRNYRFPTAKVTVMTVADQKGSDALAPWIQRISDRYQTRVDIDGIADVSMIPKPFHGMFRDAFRKKLTRSVMLDWNGDVVKLFNYKKGVPNVYVIDREGRIVARASGGVSDEAIAPVIQEIDRALEKGGR